MLFLNFGGFCRTFSSKSVFGVAKNQQQAQLFNVFDDPLCFLALLGFFGPRHSKTETNAEKLHLKSCFADVRKNNLLIGEISLQTENRKMLAATQT